MSELRNIIEGLKRDLKKKEDHIESQEKDKEQLK